MVRIICILIVTSLASCATLLNSKKDYVHIEVSKPMQLSIGGDTTFVRGRMDTAILRSKHPLHIVKINDSIIDSIAVKPRLSAVCYTYLYLGLAPLFLIDLTNPRRFSYPHLIYIDSLRQNKRGYRVHRPFDKSLIPFRHAIKFSPFRLIGVLHPGIELSYEFHYTNRLSTQVSVAHHYKSLYHENPQAGYRIGLQQRYYFMWQTTMLYAATQVDYINEYFESSWTFGDYAPWLPDAEQMIDDTYYDEFNVAKEVWIGSIIIGAQTQFKNRIFVDGHIGLGLRHRSVRHFDRENLNDNMVGTRHPNIIAPMIKPGKYWTVSIPLNLRVGYAF